MADNNLVLLERFYDPGLAQIARGILESSDIPCFLFDEQMNAVAWPLQSGLGGVRLMVLLEHVEEATDILSALLKQNGDFSKSQPLLPETKKGRLKALISAFLLFFAGIILPLKDRNIKNEND